MSKIGISLLRAIHDWRIKRKDNFLPTPFPELDAAIGGGIPRGKTTVIGGEPSVSKSRFLLELLWHSAQRGKKALLIDVELGRTEIIQRLVCSEANLAPIAARAKPPREIIERISRFASLRILDLGGAIPLNKLSRYMELSKADIIGLDSLQRLALGSDEEAARQKVQHLMHLLERHAKEHNCAVVITSEIKRGSDGGYHFKPSDALSIFSESRSIEYAADVAIALQPKKGSKKIIKPGVPHDKLIKIIIAKNRPGGVEGILNADLVLAYPTWRIYEQTGDEHKRGPRAKELTEEAVLILLSKGIGISVEALRGVLGVKRERLETVLGELHNKGLVIQKKGFWKRC